MSTTIAVDGNYYLHRAFNSVASRKDLNYLEKNLLTLVLQMVTSDIVSLKGSHAIVMFDSPRPFRKEIYPDYKAGRLKRGEPVEVKRHDGSTVKVSTTPGSFVNAARTMFTLAGIPTGYKKGLEADDLLGCVARHTPGKIVVCSRDKDSAVLINERVRVYWPVEQKLLDVKEVRKIWGIEPEQIRDYLCLLGDGVDCQPPETEVLTYVKSSLSQEVKIGKTTYRTLAEAAKAEGVTYQALIYRLNNWKNYGSLIDKIKEPSIKKTKIKNLKKGDRVLSLDGSGELLSRAVLDVGKHSYSGHLIEVVTDTGDVSRYTPNHRALARTNNFNSEWIVYLARKGNQFRIGVTGRSVLSRLRAEGAEAVWILATSSKKESALTTERFLSWKYRIPDSVFVRKGLSCVSDKSNAYIQAFWKKVGDLTTEGTAILTAHGLDPNLPLQNFPSPKPLFGNRLSEVLAVNLRVGMSVTVVKNRTRTWSKIVSIRKVPFKGYVYSLDVEKNHNYVADNIVTHNSIPGVPGIGPKTAVSILKEYGSIAKALKSDDWRAKLLKHKSTLKMARMLVDLKTEITFHLEDLVIGDVSDELHQMVWSAPRSLKDLGEARKASRMKGLFG